MSEVGVAEGNEVLVEGKRVFVIRAVLVVGLNDVLVALVVLKGWSVSEEDSLSGSLELELFESLLSDSSVLDFVLEFHGIDGVSGSHVLVVEVVELDVSGVNS